MALIFDETFTGGAPVEAGASVVGDVTFPAGKSGEGALFGAGGYISYNTENNFNFNKGTVIIWYKPTSNMWSLYPHVSLCLLDAIWGTNKELYYYFTPTSGGSGPVVYLKPDFYRGSTSATSVSAVTQNEPYMASIMQSSTWYKVSLFWDFTQAAGECFVATKINDQFSNVAFLNPYDAGAITAGSKMYLGNGTPGGFGRSCLGLVDSVKIYDTVELTLPAGGMHDLPYTYTPHVPATMTPVLNLLADSEVQNNFDTPADPVLDPGINPAKDVMFFERPAFEPTYQNYVPAEVDIVFGTKTSISYSVPKNEVENLFFGVYTRNALTNVSVSLGAGGFTGAGTIAKANCDLRVIQNWFQGSRSGGYGCDAFPYYLPGLFLKNDQINGDNPSTGTRLDENAALSLTNLPVLPIITDVVTAMDAATSKMFALKIPATATSGEYTGTITLTADGGVSETLTLSLTILPFELKSGGKRYINSVNYQQWDDIHWVDNATCDVKFAHFEIHLAAMREMGFNWLWIYCGADGVDTDSGPTAYYHPLTNLEVVTEKCRLAAVHGFEQVIVETKASGHDDDTYDWQMEDAITAMKANGYDPWLYGYDELGTDEITTTKQKRQILAAQAFDPNVKFMTTCGSGVPAVMSALGTPLDCYLYSRICSETATAMTGVRSFDHMEGIYWQTRDYQTNRYEIGVANYLRNYDIEPCYGWQTAYYCTLYNDMDRIASDRNRPYGVIYPAIDDSVTPVFHLIPSHRGEIIREGIKDEKYLQTWKYYYDRVNVSNPTVAATSKAVIDALLVKYTDTVVVAYPASCRVTQTDYANDRATIIAQIEYLRGYDTAVSPRRSVISGVITNMWKRFRKIGGVSQ